MCNKLYVLTVLLINEDKVCESQVNTTNEYWEDTLEELSVIVISRVQEEKTGSTCSALLVQGLDWAFTAFLKNTHLKQSTTFWWRG